jgi:hypothetical protein
LSPRGETCKELNCRGVEVKTNLPPSLLRETTKKQSSPLFLGARKRMHYLEIPIVLFFLQLPRFFFHGLVPLSSLMNDPCLHICTKSLPRCAGALLNATSSRGGRGSEWREVKERCLGRREIFLGGAPRSVTWKDSARGKGADGCGGQRRD